MSLSTLSASAALPASSPLRPTHRWKVLAVGVAANAAFSAAAAGLPATAVFMRSGYRLDNDQLGLALGLMGLGVALFELPWGMLADRWGDRPVLLGGLGATAVALAWMSVFAAPVHGAAPALWLLALGLLLVGVMGGSVNGASGRAVMAWFDEGERGLAMSIRQTAVPLGGGLGALVLPWLASQVGFAAVFGLLGGLCAGAALLTLGWLREPDRASATPARATIAGRTFSGAPPAGATRVQAPSSDTRSASHPAHPAPSSPLRDARVWRAALAIGLLCSPQFAVLTFATVFLHDYSGAGIATLTAVMVAVQVGAMVARIASGRWTDRRGNRRAYLRGCIWLGFALFVALAGVAWAVRDTATDPAAVAAVAVLLAVAGICVSAWHGVAYTELATLAGAQRAGTALGLANTCVYLGLFLTPLALPHLVAAASWPLAWGVAGGLMLAALPLLPRTARA
ncbi:putative MFS-type transporter [Achromobacter deleyi]|uniref:Putative MFS-type transporter n=1 Tax=Achromobacter deleyi TaxID=1353891 RepID=A0A6S6ZM50_9BURK|nr:MFS transporter [Achromobacter deleyi]CAB3685146.1 putative MFS-type transporter [Achromobacter deleyi]CAB3867174.1 putative MFS-type transporter [Achromobacter deleyi]CAB3911009.1 putative MFS-type transporter [Achromobacter deleyi]